MFLRLVIFIILVLIRVVPPHEAQGADSILNQYDANGSLLSGDGKCYKYNDANQLVKVCEDDACSKIVGQYTYDHTGQRVKKVENGVTTWYIGKHYEAQVVAGQAQPQNTSYYFANGERVAKKDATGTYFYHPDHLGGVSAVTGSGGQVVSSTSYLPFGEVRQGGTENYYTGKQSDTATGLYNFEARYVSPELRHFTQADIAEPDFDDPQDLNRYTYVGNNPHTFVDLDGHKKKKKAKLSKREKWMIAHGTDPDKDKTPLKKAKEIFKKGEKPQVAKKTTARGISTSHVTEPIHRNTQVVNEDQQAGKVLGESTEYEQTICTSDEAPQPLWVDVVSAISDVYNEWVAEKVIDIIMDLGSKSHPAIQMIYSPEMLFGRQKKHNTL